MTPSSSTSRTEQKLPGSWQISPWPASPLPLPSLSGNHQLTPVLSVHGPALLKEAGIDGGLCSSSAFLRRHHGGACVKLYDHDSQRQLLEWIDGPRLSSLIRDKRPEEALNIYANIITRFANKQKPAAELASLESHFTPLLAQRHSPDHLIRHASRLIHFLLESEHEKQALHGNLHFDKIIRHPKRGWLAIGPQGLFGDRHFEPVPALIHPSAFPRRDSGRPDLSNVHQRASQIAGQLCQTLDLHRGRLLTMAFCAAASQLLLARRDGSPLTGFHHDICLTMLDLLVD